MINYQVSLIPYVDLTYVEKTTRIDSTNVYNDFFVKDENGLYRPLHYTFFKDFSEETLISEVNRWREIIVDQYAKFYDEYIDSVSNVYWHLNEMYDHYLEFYKWLFSVDYDKRLFWLAFHISRGDIETRKIYLVNLFNELIVWMGHTMKIIVPYKLSEVSIKKYFESLLQKCSNVNNNPECYVINTLLGNMNNNNLLELVSGIITNLSANSLDSDTIVEYINNLGIRVLEYIISENVYKMIHNHSPISEISIFPIEVIYDNDSHKSYSGFYVCRKIYSKYVVIRNDSGFEWPIVLSSLSDKPSFV